MFIKKDRLLALITAFMTVFAMLTLLPAAVVQAAAEGGRYNYCDKQDNKEAEYDGSYWKQPDRWKADYIDPTKYTGDVRIWFDKVTLKSNEARGKVQRIYCHVTGASYKVNSVSLHILYDTRLTPKRNYVRYVTNGNSLRAFASVEGNFEPGVLELIATCNLNSLVDGNLFYIDFKLPDDAMPGDVYPVGIRYDYTDVTYDLFYDHEQDYQGKLMMAYVFTEGIENGYIAVEDGKLVEFQANGGTGETKGISRSAASNICILPDCGFEPPEDMEFDCWEYTDGSFAGYEDDTIRLYDTVTTLRARWKNAPVSRVSITVSEPMAGGNPAYEASADKAGVRIVSGPEWFDGKIKLTEDHVFTEGKGYTAQVSISANEGWRFAEDPEVSINGVSAEYVTDGEEVIRTYRAVLTAQKKEHGSGDISGDGVFDIEDVVMVISHINGNFPLSDEQLVLADIDGSGEVDIIDAVIMINMISGNI